MAKTLGVLGGGLVRDGEEGLGLGLGDLDVLCDRPPYRGGAGRSREWMELGEEEVVLLAAEKAGVLGDSTMEGESRSS